MRRSRVPAFIALASIAAFLASCEEPPPASGPSAKPSSTAAFFDDFDGAEVDSSKWHVATWAEHGGQTGTDRCFAKDGYLTMQFINDDGRYLSSAIESRETFLFGRWEYRAKCSSVPGILNSFYTIDWGEGGSGTKQEIDIEFLTKDFSGNAGKVCYAVHAEGKTSYDGGAANLAFNPSSDFHVYGFDIGPTRVQWLVDGRVTRTYVYSKGDIEINAPYIIKLNVWTKHEWIGGPPASGVICTYLIDWVKFTPAE